MVFVALWFNSMPGRFFLLRLELSFYLRYSYSWGPTTRGTLPYNNHVNILLAIQLIHSDRLALTYLIRKLCRMNLTDGTVLCTGRTVSIDLSIIMNFGISFDSIMSVKFLAFIKCTAHTILKFYKKLINRCKI